MIRELNCSNELAALALSTFQLGFEFAPLVLAPFSEAYGRYTMYAASAVVVLIFFIPIALAKNIGDRYHMPIYRRTRCFDWVYARWAINLGPVRSVRSRTPDEHLLPVRLHRDRTGTGTY